MENENEVIETKETETEVKETETKETETETKSENEIKLEQEIEKYKKLISKANSEAADYKKQLRSKMTEDEVKADEQKKLLEELEQYKTEKKISETAKGLMSWGMDTDKADTMARSLVEGDITSFITGGKEYYDSVSQKAIAEAMDKSKLSSGRPPEKKDVEQDEAAKMRKIMGLPDAK